MPTVDMIATGENIKNLMKVNNITVVSVQKALGFGTPQAIYKWFKGITLPTIDNLVMLAHILGTDINKIIITKTT